MRSLSVAFIVGAIVLVGMSLGQLGKATGQPPLAGSAARPLFAEQPDGWSRTELFQGPADSPMGRLNQEEARAERETASLLDKYSKATDDAQRSKLKTQLSTALEKQFDLQQKRREMELKQVEERLARLRTLMQKRSDAKQTIIEKRLDQLVREAEGLGWTAPPGMRGSVNIFGGTGGFRYGNGGGGFGRSPEFAPDKLQKR
jgi:hypothetical protein